MKILFVTARFPFPPVKGDKSVAYNRLKYFSAKHDITLLSFADTNEDMRYLPEIAKFCRDVHVVPFRRMNAAARLALKGYQDVPLQVLYYQSGEFKKKLDALLDSNAYDLLHVFMLRMAPYAASWKGCPKILELIDSMELNMQRRAGLERGVKKWIFAEEARRLSRYESLMTTHYDYSVVVSDLDRQTIKGTHIEVAPIGIDADRFRPDTGRSEGDVIIFSGNMSYFPNETAALYFAETIFPKIQALRPGVRFRIAGGGASARVRKLADANKAISVLGYVDSVADQINRASVAVCPMRAGSGIQFKILESLACGVPLVATSVGKGVVALGEDAGLFTADDPDAFAAVVVRLLADTAYRAVHGQIIAAAVKAKYSWDASNRIIENMYAKVSGGNG